MAVDPDPNVVAAAGPDHGLGLAAAAGHAGPGNRKVSGLVLIVLSRWVAIGQTHSAQVC